MREVEQKMNWGFLSLGLALGLGLIISTCIFTNAFARIKREGQSIEVSGFAQKQITSDWASWSCTIGIRAATLAEANTQLGEARKKVVDFLTAKGAKPANLELDPVSMQAVYGRDERGQETSAIESYRLSQTITFSNSDIEMVASAAQNSSDLVGEGVDLSAEAPKYYYTKLDDLKMEMLGAAASNALLRAKMMAAQSQSGVGALTYIHQGVFQITPPYSNEVSDYGVNDTSSKIKIIKAIVTARYMVSN